MAPATIEVLKNNIRIAIAVIMCKRDEKFQFKWTTAKIYKMHG